jgi:hypothetical protein
MLARTIPGRTIAMPVCVAVVQIPMTTPRSTEQAIESARKSAPTFQGLAAKGLVKKHYLNSPTSGGGVYLWESRAAAEAWFTKERLDDMEKRFGARPTVTYFDSYVTVDNTTGRVLVEGEPVPA